MVYKCGTQYRHGFYTLDPSSADNIQAAGAEKAKDHLGMYLVARRVVSGEKFNVIRPLLLIQPPDQCMLD
jgi:hypothetical protein